MNRISKALTVVFSLALLTAAWAASPTTAPADDDKKISVETAPPVVVTTVPQAGATNVDASTKEIKVTFSKKMADKSWSWSTWGEENFPKTTGEPHYEADGRTCVLPVELQPGKTYAIWVNSDKFDNFRDSSGRPAVPYLLVFETKR